MTTYETRVYVGKLYNILCDANGAVKDSVIPNYDSISVTISDVDILGVNYDISVPIGVTRHNSPVRERIRSSFPVVIPVSDVHDAAHYQAILDVIVHDLYKTAYGGTIRAKLNVWCERFIAMIEADSGFKLTNPLTTVEYSE